jgi:uracil phosphoribosyltransferase
MPLDARGGGMSSPASVSNTAVKALLGVFLRRGFKYLSQCRGGYAACHALILASDGGGAGAAHALELVDHNQAACLECTGRRKVKEKKVASSSSFLQNVRRLANNLAGQKAVVAENAESIEEFEASHIPDNALVLLPPTSSTSASPSSSSSSLSSLSAAGGGGGVPNSPSLSGMPGGGANNAMSSGNGMQSPLGGGGGSSSNLSLRLLLTVLRDKNVDVSSFADVLHRLTALLLLSFFDRVEVRDRNVSTGAGSLYSGVESTPVTTIALGPSDLAMEMIDSAFHPFRPVCKRQSGTYVQASSAATSDASPPGGSLVTSGGGSNSFWSSVSLPANVTESNVLLFVPILTPEEAPALLALLDDLVLVRGVEAGQVTLLAVLVARPVLWALARRYPDLLIVAAAVDELTPQGRLVPGISAWEDRYRAAR